MVEITDRHHVFGINLVWRIDIFDDEWASESINILSTNVSMVPVGTGCIDDELIDKGSSRLDGALSDHRGAICKSRVDLAKTMEVDRSGLISKIVCNRNDDGIPSVDTDGRVRPLPINTDKRP